MNEIDLGNNNFLTTPKNREFLTSELQLIFNVSSSCLCNLIPRLGLNPRKENRGSTHINIWSYSDYLILKSWYSNKDKNFHKEFREKSLKGMIDPVDPIDADNHPLIKDKKFLNLNYWPDVIPNCLIEVE